eukprot:TRINITY_DN25692_c0_g1_i1.p1 TRINITY_DN25692_c0_g1~~TRINITY_DN25692_c0_g1_i1.p1  ORF type:complete len:247 (+),score=22.13 TRINITY_DN25692_c0_g1_i1:50-742(+)
MCIRDSINDKELKARKVQLDAESGDCPVCMSEMGQTGYQLWVCKHSFCLDCAKSLVQEGLTDYSKIPVKCPMCDVEISLFDIRRLLSADDSHRFNMAAKSLYIRNNSHFYFECLTPNCEGLGVLSNLTYECSLCSQTWCTRCKVDHKGFTCEQYEHLKKDDNSLLEYLKSSSAKRCPHCNMVIEKNGGCNHVTCRNCNKHICWFTNCLVYFETGTECYSHMREVHGSIGL